MASGPRKKQRDGWKMFLKESSKHDPQKTTQKKNSQRSFGSQLVAGHCVWMLVEVEGPGRIHG